MTLAQPTRSGGGATPLTDLLVDEIFDAMNEGRLVDSCNLLFNQDRFTIFNQIVVDYTCDQLEGYATDLYYKSLDYVLQTFHRRRKLMLEHTNLPTDLVKMIEDYLDLASSILPRLPKRNPRSIAKTIVETH